jgi:DNA (cytosine-5)-methyltransferase 1
MRPRLLDLFCGGGGAGMGYSRAGFDVLGVDNRPQKNYPFKFVQADALNYLRDHGNRFDVIHASPPCQAYSRLKSIKQFATKVHSELIEPTRQALEASGCFWIMENVPGAKLRFPVILCGSMFGLGAVCRDGVFHQLRRHRLFESNVMLFAVPCNHVGKPVGVYGNGGGKPIRASAAGINGFTGNNKERREAMGIDWMSRYETSQAIPPAYTEFLGKQLMGVIHETVQ